MLNIKEYWKTIVICFSFILITILFVSLVNKDEDFYFEFGDNPLKNYAVNELIPIYVTDEQIAQRYLSEFVKYIIYEPKKAYDLLDSEFRETKFGNFESFNYFIKDRYLSDAAFYKASVRRYGYEVYKGKNSLFVYDEAGNNFVFIENALMDYRVEIL